MSVTREDIVRYVGTAFIGGGAHRFDLVALARAAAAPDAVVRVLRGLPDRRFDRLYDVWDHLPEIPSARQGDERHAPTQDVVALPPVRTSPAPRHLRAA
jgi:hypothetical protein